MKTRPATQKIQDKVKKTIHRFHLFEKGDKILIACSGGADSVCLLHLLKEIQTEWSWNLSVGHFNHGLRPEADKDEHFVEILAQKYGLPFYRKREKVKEYASKKRLNLEEAGRERRYAFLQNIAAKIGGAKVATAHSMTDQAETVLMRLLRGTGMRGLAGILPTAGGNIVRPLIQVERDEIEAYLAERELTFRQDKSNLDRRIFRNKIRLDLLPELQKSYSRQIVTHLSRLADMLREEDDLLEAITREKAATVVAVRQEEIRLNLRMVNQFPKAMQRRLVREFLCQLRGDLRGLTFADIENILVLGDGKEWHLGKKWILSQEKGFLFLKKSQPPPQSFSYRWEPGLTLDIKELGIQFTGGKLKRAESQELDFNDNVRIFLDRRKLRFPLTVRSRREGDRYRPLGTPGRNKLKEIMRSKGIPARERDKHPVFLSGNEIIWVLGLPVSEKYKVSEDTTEIFVVRKISSP